ncbi:hypothetical protein VNO77_11006 [Canavalia gladiata]|uniref:Uncharacterized protein n=1 Tax=Canavalia gladiata TaxID=3824 RepID=A0AAN9MBI2_CANGL
MIKMRASTPKQILCAFSTEHLNGDNPQIIYYGIPFVIIRIKILSIGYLCRIIATSMQENCSVDYQLLSMNQVRVQKRREKQYVEKGGSVGDYRNEEEEEEEDEYIARSEAVPRKATMAFTRAGPHYSLLFLFVLPPVDHCSRQSHATLTSLFFSNVEDRLKIRVILVCLRMRNVQESNSTSTDLPLSSFLFSQLFNANSIF